MSDSANRAAHSTIIWTMFIWKNGFNTCVSYIVTTSLKMWYWVDRRCEKGWKDFGSFKAALSWHIYVVSVYNAHSTAPLKAGSRGSVYLCLKFGLSIDTGALTELLQPFAVLGSLAKSCHQVEALTWLRVGLLLQLHGVTPCTLCLHQN